MKVAVIISMIDEICQSQIWGGIQEAAFERQVDLVTFITETAVADTVQDHFSYVTEIVASQKFDGIILFSGALTQSFHTKKLSTLIETIDLPVVSLDGELAGCTNIIINNRSAISEQVAHLVTKHNRQSIVFIKGPSTNSEAQERLEAYESALWEQGIPFNRRLVFEGDFSKESGHKAVDALLKSKIPFDAIIGADDVTAIGALEALRKHSIAVPSAVSVIGFDNIAEATMVTPALSTTAQPFEEIGRLAVEKLCSLPLALETISLSTTPCYRTSCGCISEEITLFRENVIISKENVENRQKIKGFLRSAGYLIDQMQEEVMPPQRKEFRTFVTGAVHTLWESFSLGVLSEENKSRFLTTLVDILEISRSFCASTLLWKLMITRLLHIDMSSDQRDRVEKMYYLQQEARIVLDDFEEKQVRLTAYNDQEFNREVREACQCIMHTSSTQMLYDVLGRELLRLGVEEAEILVFDPYSPIALSHWQTPKEVIEVLRIEQGKVVLRSDDASAFNLNSKQIHFTSLTEGNTLILPLFLHEEYLGILSINYSYAMPKVMYEELRVHISLALKSNQLFDSLRALSMKDELTDLSNRRGFMLLSQQLYTRLREEEGTLSVLYFDMDNLKVVNDTHGHEAGDAALRVVAALLQKTFRKNDIIGRLGGDEFAVVFECGVAGTTEIIIARLKSLILQYNQVAEHPVKIALSIGVVQVVCDGSQSFMTTLHNADKEMLKDKKERRRQG